MPAPKQLDPTVSLAALYGAKVRKLRMKAGWTQRDLGERVHVVSSRIAQIELATEKVPEDLSDALDETLKADGDLCDLWWHMVRESYPNWSRRFMDLELKAMSRHEFGPVIVPGLLQTEAYARAVLRAGRPNDAAELIEERVGARLSRQAILHGPTPLCWFILEETVLQRPVGGTDVLRGQLRRLAEVARLPHVTMQVLPLDTGAHAALGGDLTILGFRNGPNVAYVEGSYRGQLVEQAEDVAEFGYAYDLLQAQALTPEASLAVIQSAMEDVRDEQASGADRG